MSDLLIEVEWVVLGDRLPADHNYRLYSALVERQGIFTLPRCGDRQSLRIKDRQIVGYCIAFENLRPEESICLQQQGIGGRRKMGCGVFVKPDWSEKC